LAHVLSCAALLLSHPSSDVSRRLLRYPQRPYALEPTTRAPSLVAIAGSRRPSATPRPLVCLVHVARCPACDIRALHTSLGSRAQCRPRPAAHLDRSPGCISARSVSRNPSGP